MADFAVLAVVCVSVASLSVRFGWLTAFAANATCSESVGDVLPCRLGFFWGLIACDRLHVRAFDPTFIGPGAGDEVRAVQSPDLSVDSSHGFNLCMRYALAG